MRPVGCWAPKETKVAVDQTSGRKRMNIHGAIDLETGQTVNGGEKMYRRGGVKMYHEFVGSLSR